MNKIFSTAFAIVSTFLALPVTATDFYVGAGLGTHGSMTLGSGPGRLEPDNSPQPFVLYGGYNFTDRWALEGGFVSFGEFRYPGERKIGLSAMYLAAKGSVPISESWTAFGKVGAAAHSIKVTGNGLPFQDRNKVTPLLGVGLSYKLTQNFKLDLELVNYGRVMNDAGTAGLRYREVQAGLRYSF